MQGRALPPLAVFAEAVARQLQGSSRVLYAGDYPSAAIALGDRHPLLIRDHGHSLSLSLPLVGSWSVQTQQELRAAVPMIQRALASSSQPYSMADAALVLMPLLGHLPLPGIAQGVTSQLFRLSFPGTPVPQEAWLRHGASSIGLFQSQDGVTVVVWVGGSMQQRHLPAHAGDAALGPWLAQALEEQRRAQEADDAEEKRKAALPLPDYDEVLALLRSGGRVVAGGARYATEFFWDSRLRCEIFDEGHTMQQDATEEDLRAQIGHHPDSFRDALAKR